MNKLTMEEMVNNVITHFGLEDPRSILMCHYQEKGEPIEWVREVYETLFNYQ